MNKIGYNNCSVWGETDKAANNDDDYDQAMMKVMTANGDAVCRSGRIGGAWNGFFFSFLSNLLVP